MVAATESFDGTADENDDDNDDVEHDVKDDPIVDSHRCLEQHNIMSSITGATARRKIKSNTQELQERRTRVARPYSSSFFFWLPHSSVRRFIGFFSQFRA